MSRHLGIGMTSQRTRDRLISRLESEGISSLEVLDAMRATPRHIFVDEALASRAYEDTALPIGYSQTISQPYIVAKMSEVLLLSGSLSKVLEIGTGSGYQAAILARLVKEVYSVERIEPLIRQARARFQELTLRNIRRVRPLRWYYCHRGTARGADAATGTANTGRPSYYPGR